MTLLTLSVDTFRIYKIQHDGRPPFWQIEKSPYLRSDLTDRHKILHDHAPDSLNRIRSFKEFLKYKMADGRHFDKTLNRNNSATFHRIATKFSTMTKPTHDWTFDFLQTKMADGRCPNMSVVHIVKATQQRSEPVRCQCQWGAIGATWRIRLNRPCAAVMRPFVKSLDYLAAAAAGAVVVVDYWQAGSWMSYKLSLTRDEWSVETEVADYWLVGDRQNLISSITEACHSYSYMFVQCLLDWDIISSLIVMRRH